MKKLLSLSLLLSVVLTTNAQDKKKEDQKAIKAMCGCYEVEFNFAETFKYSKNPDYKASPTKYDKGLEWVQLVEDTENKIVMQHLLIVRDTMIIKHWRQDWLFENTDLYTYHKDNSWKYNSLPKSQVKGQWSQKVYQVDDSPRYEGTATWSHYDGKHVWENTTDAPLPRREHTIRGDYNVLQRTNVHEITSKGWIHDQDNVKIDRADDGTNTILAKEKGTDYYVKVDDAKCIAAQNYWKKNNELWKNVRNKWQSIFDRKKDISLHEYVEASTLYSYLFKLKSNAPKSETDKIIDSFVK